MNNTVTSRVIKRATKKRYHVMFVEYGPGGEETYRDGVLADSVEEAITQRFRGDPVPQNWQVEWVELRK